MARARIPPTNQPPIAGHVVHSRREPWPAGVLNAAGAIPDFPSLNEIRNGYGPDARRERFTAPANRRLTKRGGLT